jgi:hypothetical protein
MPSETHLGALDKLQPHRQRSPILGAALVPKRLAMTPNYAAGALFTDCKAHAHEGLCKPFAEV